MTQEKNEIRVSSKLCERIEDGFRDGWLIDLPKESKYAGYQMYVSGYYIDTSYHRRYLRINMKPKAYCKIQVVTDEYQRIVYKFKLIQLPKKSVDSVGNGCLINVTNGSRFSPSGIHYLNSIDVRQSDLNCFVKYCLDYISGISQSFKRITIIKKKVNVNCKMECVK